MIKEIILEARQICKETGIVATSKNVLKVSKMILETKLAYDDTEDKTVFFEKE